MQLYKNLKLGYKLAVSFGLIILLSLGAIIGYNLMNTYDSNLAYGEAVAEDASADAARPLQMQLATLHARLEAIRSQVLDASQNGTAQREDIVRQLGSMLSEHPQLLALYTLWEPDAFDGQDADNRSKAAYDDATGRFIPYVYRTGDGTISSEPLPSYTTPGIGDYYLEPKRTKQLYWMDPTPYMVGGQEATMTSLILPIISANGDFLGIVGGDILLDTLQQQIEEQKPMGGYTVLIAGNGQYIAHGLEPERAGTSFIERNPDTWERLQSGESKMYQHRAGGDVLRLFEPVRVPGSEATWFYMTVIPKATILESFYEDLTFSMIIAAVSLLLLGGVTTLIIRYIVKQVRQVNHLATLMADGDLTVTLPVKSKDEFGTMALNLNRMSDNLRTMVQTVSQHSLSVGATSEELTASAEQTSSAAESIATSIQEVSSGAETQRHELRESSRSMHEIAEGVSRIAVSASAAASASQEVAERTQQGNLRMLEAGSKMSSALQSVEETTQTIRSLHSRSEEISRITGLITQISNQTNLLALNASIEAARAGEHGRGFAVVAAEIRKLAEQSKASAEQINGMLEAVQQDTRKAVHAMEQGSIEVADSAESVQESGRLFTLILEQISDVSRQMEDVSATSQQISAGSEQVSSALGQLRHVSDSAADQANQVAAASEEQLATMEEITSASEGLADMVQELLQLMSKFRT
ncbi:methyl-accepting chemotaxis protein [Paenibacillus sambharensis]|nr:methyl-accepting chemotaxis protein [Paenibacillus sambharensis]